MSFSTIRTVGATLPADVFDAVVSGGTALPGLSEDSYRLELGMTPREAANRAWSVLTGAWRGYRAAVEQLPEGDRAVGLTRDKWLAIVLRELGYFPRPTPAGGLLADDRAFPVSHQVALSPGVVPLHLLGWGVDLDRRTPGLAGAADRAPHAMVQEYLNRADHALWGLVSNGRILRLLRDSSTLIGQSYVEFDLETMFDGEVFSDFVVLFLVCHATRITVDGEETPLSDCWLERWRTHAAETGTRALAALSPGVQKAIEALGTGFLRHPANAELRHWLEGDAARRVPELREALLRLVYRLLFCFVAEDRDLLLDPQGDPLAKERYRAWFSTDRLRRIATRRRGNAHGDLWVAMSLVLDGLGRERGRPELALPGLGGLFERGAIDVVDGCQLSNEAFLAALRHLTVVQPIGGGSKRRVDYRNLGAEELGSVYESLLELVPRYDRAQRVFSLEAVAGNDRKKTGAYYTPSSLIDCLLDSALDPLLDEAERAADPEAALLAVTVCDPACGSGHFLVAAAKRIAARLTIVRVRRETGGDREPTLLDEQRAMHDVVDHCIFGVDLNPMAAELARVSLWLESVQPGRALSFVDAHIKVGNALLGTTPRLLASGIPDEAFTALDGDDRKWVGTLKKRNREERENDSADLFSRGGVDVSTSALRARVAAVESLPSRDLRDVHITAQRYREVEGSPELQAARHVADAWCTAFVAAKRPSTVPIVHSTLTRLQATGAGPHELYRFFHWHLEFPQIFSVPDVLPAGGPGWTGGFACVLGNPPWERIKLQEQEFFASLDPDIAAAPNAAARKRKIAELAERNPDLLTKFQAAKRQADGESQLIRLSGRYPLCGRGDINTYAIFAEHDRTVLGPTGRLGVILPTGIATDATTQHFFKDLVSHGSLVSLFDFENSRPVFDGVHRSFKFCLLTLGGLGSRVDRADFAFFLQHPDDLAREGARFELTPAEILLLNPNTGTCPVFRSRRDAEITLAIYRRWPVLIRDGVAGEAGNPWGLSFMTMFHMSNDSGLFRNREQLEADNWLLVGNIFKRHDADGLIERMLPLYQALMASHFDHRVCDVVRSPTATQRPNQPEYISDEAKDSPSRVAQPTYWVNSPHVDERVRGFTERSWFLGWRKITSPTNERTFLSLAIPLSGVGDSILMAAARRNPHLLYVATTTLAFDYVARQMLGGLNFQYYIAKQLPVPQPQAFEQPCPWDSAVTYAKWIEPRALELTYTADDMTPFAQDLGDYGRPFRWNVERRAQLRAELDAAFFHLYGLDRDDTEHVLGTFRIANENDPGLTPRILAAYDALAHAAATNTPFVSPLTPPPGHGPRHP